MTCLYCGKKLGFFSRYKDTPFCSEEHLRAHQEEMERALMERLGSKLSAQPGSRDSEVAAAPKEGKESSAKGKQNSAKSEAKAANKFEAPLEQEKREGAAQEIAPRETATRQNASREGQVRESGARDAAVRESTKETARETAREKTNHRAAASNKQGTSLAPIPAAERPIDKKSLLEGKESPAPSGRSKARPAMDEEGPSPICDDFFEAERQAALPLPDAKPWHTAASFAIIVQAEFSTPTMPDIALEAKPPEDDTEFLLEPEAIPYDFTANTTELPTSFASEDFSERTVEYPKAATDTSRVAEEFAQSWNGFALDETLVPLEYQAETEVFQNNPIGGRPPIPLRPRQRYPYAGSQIETNWREQTDEAPIFAFTHAEEWAAIEPPAPSNHLEESVKQEDAEVIPLYRVQLSIGALVQQTLREEEHEQFEADRFEQSATPLMPQAGLFLDSAYGDWAPKAALPQGATVWNPNFRFPKAKGAGPMPGLNIPSLFQLNAVLPPAPERNVNHG